MTRPVLRWLGVGVVVGVAAVALGVFWRPAYGVAIGALAVGALGAALAAWGKELGKEDQQERHQRGPGLERRRLLMRLGAVSAGLVTGGVVVPAAFRVGSASARLRDTGWEEGVGVVDEQGRPLRVGEVQVDSLFTVYPEGRVGDPLAQAVLVGVEPERVRMTDGRYEGAPEGLLAYSKLCTHMACPVGLYEPQEGTVVCPCHQAVFDLLSGGEAVAGPTTRALPRLPLSVDGDGYLVAAAGFTDFVGTGFWSAP